MKTTLITVLIWMLLAFAPVESPEFIGTYGASENDPAQISLTIKADHTYTYTDYSSRLNKINSTGTWSEKGQKVVLTDNNGKKNFHRIWTFHNAAKQAKSHKGMTFYTLCRNN